MRPQKYDIEAVRGDDYSDLRVRWDDADGVAVPLTSARMQIRSQPDSASAELTITTADDLDIDGDGYLVPTLSATQTASLVGGYYDVEATSTAGKVKTLVGGRFRVIADVTRS